MPSAQDRDDDSSSNNIGQLILAQKWDDVIAMLRTEKGKVEVAKMSARSDDRLVLTTVLHLCCEFHAPLAVVKPIVHLEPSNLLQCDNFGHTPLHVAANFCGPLHVIKYLLSQLPHVASLLDLDGRTPLILYCQRISTEMHQASDLTHAAAASDAKVLGVIRALCIAAPLSVNVEDSSGMSASEYAERCQASSEIRELLLENCGEAQASVLGGEILKTLSKNKSFDIVSKRSRNRAKVSPPLVVDMITSAQWNELSAHLSGEKGKTEAVMLRTIHEDCEMKITTAVHLACARRAPLHIVQQLVRTCPFSIPQLDSNGQTPLHVALEHGTSLDVIEFLVSKFPAAATMVDRQGKTSLMLFCQNINRTLFASGDYIRVRRVIQKLCDIFPPMIDLQDDKGKTALEVAKANEAPRYIIDAL